ncbi:uncharacterized protein B0I36DRAFT_316721 [Microdochium trichocladiopsis]|uniref:Secreted protein n=1 Tax=Microdochium trichocladiopsis TaxID=1682393 RepID=A0A9P9BQA0_9PEZI|nr:uncharacterized protein B0I36DRAFT_316721 [Microdochium trichocladiopsis]KAH7034663.1 hypothetical protein B0I36DRAFT_316721 [Microdochium trichocladiopsis]
MSFVLCSLCLRFILLSSACHLFQMLNTLECLFGSIQKRPPSLYFKIDHSFGRPGMAVLAVSCTVRSNSDVFGKNASVHGGEQSPEFERSFVFSGRT